VGSEGSESWRQRRTALLRWSALETKILTMVGWTPWRQEERPKRGKNVGKRRRERIRGKCYAKESRGPAQQNAIELLKENANPKTAKRDAHTGKGQRVKGG